MRLLFIIILANYLISANAQSSFAATKFELNSNLPIEDLAIAGLSHDEKSINIKKPAEKTNPTPKENVSVKPTEQKKDKKKNSLAELETAVANTQVSKTTKVNPRDQIVLFKPRTNSLPLPLPPQQASAGGEKIQQILNLKPTSQIQQNVDPVVLTGTLPPVQPQPAQPLTLLPQLISIPQLPLDENIENIQQEKIQRQNQNSNFENPDKWFRQNFDISNCPRNADIVSNAFRQKFPQNLLRNGKQDVLASLLATRIKECYRKQNLNQWSRLDALLDESDVPATEKEECLGGLVEEQIACINIILYSCQFIQPSFAFRFVPTRIIVQEARFAEEGADKCRKFVRKFKKMLTEA